MASIKYRKDKKRWQVHIVCEMAKRQGSDMKTTVVELKDHAGGEVTLCGWLYNSRSSGKLLFMIVRDGTGLCQCVVEKGKVPDELFDELRRLGRESSLLVTGACRQEERSAGGHEMAVTAGEGVCSANDYPNTPKAHGIPYPENPRDLLL